MSKNAKISTVERNFESKRLLAAVAVLAVVFVFLAAAPIALTDSNATRTTTTAEAVTTVSASNAIGDTGGYFVDTVASYQIKTTTDDTTLYIASGAEISITAEADMGAKKITVYMAAGQPDADGNVKYYEDSKIQIGGASGAVSSPQELSVYDGGYKLTGTGLAVTTDEQYVTATYLGYKVLWTAGMASAKTNWSLDLVDTATDSKPGTVVVSTQSDEAQSLDGTVYELTVDYTGGTPGSVKLKAPFVSDGQDGSITLKGESNNLKIEASKTMISGEVRRVSGTFWNESYTTNRNLEPVIANGVAQNGLTFSQGTRVTVSEAQDMILAYRYYAGTLTVYKDTTLSRDIRISSQAGTATEVILNEGLKTSSTLTLGFTGWKNTTYGTLCGESMTVSSEKPWTGASIDIKDTDWGKYSAYVRYIHLKNSVGPMDIASRGGQLAVYSDYAVICGTVTIEGNAGATEQANYTPFTMTDSTIAKSGCVEMKEKTKIDIKGTLNVLGTLTGAGDYIDGNSGYVINTPDGNGSNVTITGANRPSDTAFGVAEKTLTVNTVDAIGLATEQGFKVINLKKNEAFQIADDYTFPEGVKIAQVNDASVNSNIIIGGGGKSIEVTIPFTTTLVLNGQESGYSIEVAEKAILNVEGEIRGTSKENKATIGGGGTFNMASSGAVDSGMVSVETKHVTGTIVEIQVDGTMETDPYPIYQKIVIPKGKTAVVNDSSTVAVLGQLEVDGTLIVKNGGILTLGKDSTVQTAEVAVGSNGSITVENGGAVSVKNAAITVNGGVSLEGSLQLDSPSTLTVGSRMTESSTGIIGMADGAYISVGIGGVLTLNGYLGMDTHAGTVIKNSGSVIIDNAGIAPRAMGPHGSATVSLVADSASVDIKSYLVEKNNAKITVDDVGLRLAEVDGGYYHVVDDAAAADGAKNYIVQYNKIEIGSDSADAKIGGSILITEKLTSKVFGDKLEVFNVMEISGNISNTSTVSAGAGSAPTVDLDIGSSTSSVSVTGGLTTYSELSFSANVSVPSKNVLTIGQRVSVTNSGVLEVAGYIDMTATGVSSLSNSGSISVTGKVKINAAAGDISGAVNAAKYVTVEGESSVRYNNYTSLDQAIVDVLDETNKNTSKDIVICGIIDIPESADTTGGTFDSEGYSFKITSDSSGPFTVEVTKFSGGGGSITIPSAVNHEGTEYKVTSIGAKAFSPDFKGTSGLISVTIPDSVTCIKALAFYSCTDLTSVSIPDSVKTIEKAAFYQCTGLTSVTIHESVDIGQCAFDGCTGLTSVTISDSVTLGRFAFYGCTKIENVSFGDNVKIGEMAFRDCIGIKSISFKMVQSIHDTAFRDDSGKSTKFYDTDGKLLNTSNIRDFQGKTFIGNIAEMTRETRSHTLTFNPNNGADSWTVSYSSGDWIDEPSGIEKVGYTLECWADEEGKKFDFHTIIMPDRDMTLTAVWTAIEYPINISGPLTVRNGDERITSGTSVAYGTELTVEAEERTGYMSKVLLNGEELTGGVFTVGLTNVLGVEYTPNGYAVTFSGGLTVKNDGVAIASGATVAYGTELTVEAEERTGYMSKVLLNGEELTGGVFTVGLTNVLGVEYTPNGYAVTFSGGLTVKNDGVAIASGATVAYGTELTVEAEERTGYMSKVLLNGEELTGGVFTVGLTNVLGVEYTPNGYTVNMTVQGDGSVDLGELEVLYGTATSVEGNVLTIGDYTVTATPSDKNHTFTGWLGVPRIVTSNVTITASFSQIFIDDKARIETDTADIVAEKTGTKTSIVSEIRTDVADTDGAVKETLDKIAEIKAASGSPDGDVTIRLIVPVGKGSESLAMSVATVTALKDSGAELTVTNGDMAVSLDADAIGSLQKTAISSGDMLSIRVTPNPSNLSDSQKKVVGDNQVVDVSAFLGEKNVSDLGGKATISIPHVTDKKVKVTYVMDDGRTEDIECTYADEVVSFVTTHFSVYMISEIEEAVPVTPDTDNEDTKAVIILAVVAVVVALAAVFFLVDSRRR